MGTFQGRAFASLSMGNSRLYTLGDVVSLSVIAKILTVLLRCLQEAVREESSNT